MQVPANGKAHQGPLTPTPRQAPLLPPPHDSEDVLIEFQDVYKSFGDKPILRGASFRIRRGEAVGIIGGSGTGKSTTLRIAAGLLQPDAGRVLVRGVERQGLISDRPRTAQGEEDELVMGLVFQSAALFDSLTVGDNVGFLLREHSKLAPSRIRVRIFLSVCEGGVGGVGEIILGGARSWAVIIELLRP